MEQILKDTIPLLERGESVVWATVVEHKGSTPRKAAARMLLDGRGRILGSVGGGKLEAETLNVAATLGRTSGRKLLDIAMTGKEVAETEMICGGEARIFIELLSPDALPFVRGLHERLLTGGKAVFVTWVDNEDRPFEEAHLTVQRSEGRIEPLGAALEWTEEIDEAIKSNTPKLVVHPKGQGFLFIEPLKRSPNLFIFGGGHISLDLAWMADRVGFRVTVLDDREEFANRERFPMAHEVRADPFKESLKGLRIGHDDFVVIVTRGHIHDLDVLREVITQSPLYVGMIGSRRKKAMIFNQLLEEGVPKALLDGVHAPIGLDILAETPAEISVSIVAEMVQVQRKALGAGRKDWRV